jgi:hypothetical protein
VASDGGRAVRINFLVQILHRARIAETVTIERPNPHSCPTNNRQLGPTVWAGSVIPTKKGALRDFAFGKSRAAPAE